MTVREHFAARAAHYNRSSHWVSDPLLFEKLRDLLAPSPEDVVLDVACGTGLIARSLREHVQRIVGIDLSSPMTEQAKPYLDELVHANAEAMPLPSDHFDITICRQGIQFMNALRAVREMVRVTRPGGKICMVHLCAYGDEDKRDYFEILRLRNPARRNFYVRGDLARLLREAACTRVEVVEHVSREDVDIWSDNRAIEEPAREAIRRVYRGASDSFKRLHSVAINDGRIIDNMLFEIAIGTK